MRDPLEARRRVSVALHQIVHNSRDARLTIKDGVEPTREQPVVHCLHPREAAIAEDSRPARILLARRRRAVNAECGWEAAALLDSGTVHAVHIDVARFAAPVTLKDVNELRHGPTNVYREGIEARVAIPLAAPVARRRLRGR